MALGYDDLDGKFEKAAINTKLNIPAIVTLKLSKDVREQKLLNIISRQNQEDTERDNGQAEHLSYENREWMFRVPHWSKYGLGDSDDEDENDVEESKRIEDTSDLKAKQKEKMPAGESK